MGKNWAELEKEFSDHVIDWLEGKELDNVDGCRLLSYLLCATACTCGYSEENFDISVDGLKSVFRSMKKKYKKFHANKPETE